jgi:hypothetical protein
MSRWAFDDLLQGVIAASCVLEHVPHPAADVREKMPGGDPTRHLLVGEPQVRQVGSHRLVEIQHPSLYQGHDRCSGKGLGRGAYLEEGIPPALQVATGPGFFVNFSAGRTVYVGARHAPLPLRRVVWAGL